MRRFYNEPNSMILFNPHPGHLVVFLDMTLYNDCLCYSGFQQAANLVDKNPNESPGSLDQ